MMALAAMGAYTVFAGGSQCSKPCATSAEARTATACVSSSTTTASCENPSGKIAGRFDPAMSGVCRFACATKLKHSAKDVAAQPGAKVGKLTQCPVSGVVFAVDARRPHVRIGGDEYVTCCDQCAVKLKKNPRRYLRT